MNILFLFLRPGARDTKEGSCAWTGSAICRGGVNQTPVTHLRTDESDCIGLDLPAAHQSSEQGTVIYQAWWCIRGLSRKYPAILIISRTGHVALM